MTELDLSGTALGYLKKGNAITGENLEAGDILIGLPSSGIHSNGYSLVRRIMDHAEMKYNDVAPFDCSSSTRKIARFENTSGPITLGEIFLNPTRIYCNPVVDLIQYSQSNDCDFSISDIRAICHVTGGGLSNLLRLHNSLGGRLQTLLLLILNLLGLLKLAGLRLGKCIAPSTWVAE